MHRPWPVGDKVCPSRVSAPGSGPNTHARRVTNEVHLHNKEGSADAPYALVLIKPPSIMHIDPDIMIVMIFHRVLSPTSSYS